jgi:hypothetical protein
LRYAFGDGPAAAFRSLRPIIMRISQIFLGDSETGELPLSFGLPRTPQKSAVPAAEHRLYSKATLRECRMEPSRPGASRRTAAT